MKVVLRCSFVNLVMWELDDNCLGEQWASCVALLMGKVHTACLGRFLSCERLLCQSPGMKRCTSAPPILAGQRLVPFQPGENTLLVTLTHQNKYPREKPAITWPGL